MELLESPANIVFNIAELSHEIFKHCDVEVSMVLLLCNRLLYSRKDDKMLWRTKVQREFGVVRFKPAQLPFFEQYSTMKGPLSWQSATEQGRCDQLRILRRKGFLCYKEITALAIAHDRADIIQYIEEHEKYIREAKNFFRDMKIGPKVARYYAGRVFKPTDNSVAEHHHILLTMLINNIFPEDFVQLMIDDDNFDAASWYLDERIRLAHIIEKKSLTVRSLTNHSAL